MLRILGSNHLYPSLFIRRFHVEGSKPTIPEATAPVQCYAPKAGLSLGEVSHLFTSLPTEPWLRECFPTGRCKLKLRQALRFTLKKLIIFETEC